MRKITFLLVLIFAGLLLMAAPDSLYNTANKLYQEGRFEESIESYESLISAGFESSSLYYNLGNAYFRSNKLGKARLFYEKSLKLNPGDEDARINLAYLEGLLADRFEEVPEIFYKKWVKNLVSSLNSDQWSYISIFTFLLSVGTFITYLLFRRISIRKAGFFSSILFLVISISSLVAALKQDKIVKQPDAAVVTDLSVNVKSSPRETGTGLFVLHEGAKIWLEDKTGGWIEIRLSDGRKGWVPQESIEVI